MVEKQIIQRPPLSEDCVFALDIGTRSVIGIVGRPQGQLFEVIAIESREHPQRAMIDGQIEDIRQVARIAGEVKEALEEKLCCTLTKVNVAAAGRALKTGRAEYSIALPAEPVTSRQIYELEMGAIAEIRKQVSEQRDSLNYYCVGHSVVHYYLDDYPFSTIIGHKGTQARADVIATFLPTEVVDSLCAAMAIIGCEITHLTLEPIAAMNAVIPAELRLLNLALVDIGAGTSDIAISENGSVSAYTMATVAGDEITEELIRKYLVDFQTGERMKHEAAAGQEEIIFQDILGIEYTIPLKDVLNTLRPAVDNLANIICEKIREANGKVPAAVFLVGGGSLAPLLCEAVADGLGLDHKKVAVGGNNFIKRVAVGIEDAAGPEYATPLGIALTAVAEGAQHGFYLFINGKKTRLFRNRDLTVMDALLLCGYQYHQLLGHNGKNITYTFNGQKQILRGGHLTPAKIICNGVEANLTMPVNNEDRIDVTPAEDGKDAHLTLTMLEADPFDFQVFIDGTPVKIGRASFINSNAAVPGQEILDRDVVEIREVITLEELCAHLGVASNTLLLNGEAKDPGTPLQEGDSLTTVETPVSAPEPEPEPIPEPELETISEPETQPEPVPFSQPALEPQPEPAFIGAQSDVLPTPESEITTNAAVQEQAQAFTIPVPAQPSVPSAAAEAAAPKKAADEPELSQGAKSWMEKITQAWESSASPAVVPQEPVVPQEAPIPQHIPAPEPAPVPQEIPSPQPVSVPQPPPAPQEAPSPQQIPIPQQEPPVPQEIPSPEPVSLPQPPPVPQEAPSPRQIPISQQKPSVPQQITVPQQIPVSPQTSPAPMETPAPVQQGVENVSIPVLGPRSGIHITLNGEKLWLPQKPQGNYLFLDMLNLVDIDPAKPQGNILLLLNGRNAAYLDNVENGDEIEIRWEKRS